MLKNNFLAAHFAKTSLRNLWKNKAYSFLNIFGLAIGITCAGLIFLWAENELTYDNVNVKKDRLYEVKVNYPYGGSSFTMGSTPRLMAAAMKQEIPGIANTCRISDYPEKHLFTMGDKSVYASGSFADSSLFSMLTIPFVSGSPLTAFNQLYSIVITEKTAKKFFGNEKNIIGKTIRVDNKQDYTVTGILKDLPQNSSLQFEWLAPYEVVMAGLRVRAEINQENEWRSYGPFTLVEVNPSANINTINRQLYDYIHKKNATQTSHCFLFGMNKWHLYDEFENGKATGSGRIKQVRMLSAIAWIILLIACINFMNLATANSQKRAKEIGVRKVLGADKQKLIIQFFGESLFMSAAACVLAVVIMSISLPAFNMLMEKQLSLQLNNPVHFTGLLIITLISSLVAGSYPSVYLSSFNPVSVLKGLKIKTGGAALIRKVLVVFQFAVSVVFIISTIIVYLQIQHVKNRNLGLNKDNLIEIDMQADISSIFSLIKQDLLHTGLIENVAMSDHTTLYAGDNDNRFRWQGKPPGDDISISYRNVSPEFISTSGMKIIEGRDFRENETAESTNVIITKTLAQLISKEGVVGKIIQSPRGNDEGVYNNMTIVGVVDDYVYGNVYSRPGPVIFFCKPAENANLVYVRTKAKANTSDVLSKIETVVKKNNPAYPLQYRFVDEQFNEMFSNETLISKVSGVFAVLAIIISCMGLFGLAAYTAEQRTKEIGIRKVLGASVAGVTGLLSKDFMKLVAVSCAVSFPVAWWIMHNWLQSYEYRIAISPMIFVAAGVIALFIAFATVSFRAIKAAMANPVKSLRTE